MFETMRELTVIFFCAWKFALTFPVAVYGMEMSIKEVLLYTNLGGLLGLLFFAYLWHHILQWWMIKVKPRMRKKENKQPLFTRKKRRFIRLKNTYGLAGIVFLNPIILSIPISTFLVIRFYGRKKRYLVWLFAGQIAWSILYAVFYIYIRDNVATVF